mmetsp:Transcript_44254/g.109576  ORF Transcript_44254/g.109576 Transcript_44254/m.109576 type:complete len:220 (-) Transcript_44254:722-1381(-)
MESLFSLEKESVPGMERVPGSASPRAPTESVFAFTAPVTASSVMKFPTLRRVETVASLAFRLVVSREVTPLIVFTSEMAVSLRELSNARVFRPVISSPAAVEVARVSRCSLLFSTSNQGPAAGPNSEGFQCSCNEVVEEESPLLKVKLSPLVSIVAPPTVSAPVDTSPSVALTACSVPAAASTLASAPKPTVAAPVSTFKTSPPMERRPAVTFKVEPAT